MLRWSLSLFVFLSSVSWAVDQQVMSLPQLVRLANSLNPQTTTTPACTPGEAIGNEVADPTTSDLVDILFRPTASISERKAVSDQLGLLGRNRPLSVNAAIAELCYEVDLCARSNSDAELQRLCTSNSDESVDSDLTDSCFPSHVRRTRTCSNEVPQGNHNLLRISGTILNDYSQTYSQYISPRIASFAASASSEDVATVAQNASALGQYTLDCYQKVNQILYANDRAKLLRYYNFIRAIIDTLGIAPQSRVMVNRGAYLPDSVLPQYHQVGSVVCSRGFTSTAIHDPATDTGGTPRNSFLNDSCTQRLYINFGAGSLSGYHVDSVSTSRGENEVLLLPNTCFRVERVYPRTDPNGLNPEEPCGNLRNFNVDLTVVPTPANP